MNQIILRATIVSFMLSAGMTNALAQQLPMPPTTSDSMSARRYQAYTMIQNKQPAQALEQLYAVPNPIGWDQFMKGQASEMIGEPGKAAQWFAAAANQDVRNDEFRTKAISSLVTLCKCEEAIQMCAEGTKLTTDPQKRQYYENKMAEIQRLKQNLTKGAENIAKHKAEHHDLLQSAVENN